MSKQKPSDDPSSARESGTVRDPTSGNNPSDRANRPADRGKSDSKRPDEGHRKDDPSTAPEDR